MQPIQEDPGKRERFPADKEIILEVHGLRAGYSRDVAVIDDLSLEVRSGEILALLGPSGCGKTTFLRCLAGLEVPSAGRIVLGDRPLYEGDEGSNPVIVPPGDRNIGMVFQDWALFPHMTVAANVGFGVSERVRDKRERVSEALDLVGIAELADRLPEDLSGGQQQRTAVARSIAQKPELLLLDEPFSNLDASLRSSVRSEIRGLLSEAGMTAVLVTHDQDEAFVLGDRVAVMKDGRIRQVGTAREIYQRPADPWVAGFVGEVNLLAGNSDGVEATVLAGHNVEVFDPSGGPAPVGDVVVAIRPEQLSVGRVSPERVSLPEADLVARREFRGLGTLLYIEMANGELVKVLYTGPPEDEPEMHVRVHAEGGPFPAFAADDPSLEV